MNDGHADNRSPVDEPGARSESLASGYFWTFGSTALPLVSAFTVSLIVARTMGPRAAGLINLTMAVATIFLIVAKFGVDGAGSRLVSEYTVSSPNLIRPLARASLLLRLAFTLPTSAAAFLLAPAVAGLYDDPDLVVLFRLGALVILSVSFNELAALLLLGLKRFRTLFAMRTVMLVIRVGLVAGAAVLALGPSGVIWAYIAAAAITGASVFVHLSTSGEGVADTGEIRMMRSRLWRLSMTLAVSGASVTIYSLLDKIMLGYFRTAADVGIYSMARNLLETSLFPIFALVMTLRPALAGSWASGDVRRCGDLVNRSVTAAFAYAACVSTVFACLAGPLVTGLFSDKFAASAGILVLFIPLLVMRSIGAVILPGLIAADKAGTYAKLTVAGAVTNFILNALLIPRWGAEGAVISTLLSYLPIEVLGLAAVSREIGGLRRRGDISRGARIAAVSILIWAVHSRFGFVPSGLPATVIHASILSAVFLLLVLAVRGIEKERILDLLGPVLRTLRIRSK
jgi:O-antigen/teichoic acid export membrane protein